ncbi:hypothetical protein CTheo_7266 [Ceratobasidium theobromae]|uniref:Tyrosinase copper-binding domain-containing protein n=1 Tax=Ceratobasidium theobromae TaxID=1582974 RepID=A0A5N5QCX3_9AGAM|nr:hypothetical protein CTheo_7266 [Ceratobasidium theobromae]
MKTSWASLLSVSFAILQCANAVSATRKCKSIEVRKEWRALSRKEKKAWIDAVNCLNRTPRSGNLKPPLNMSDYPFYDYIVPESPEGTYYDELVYVHMNLNPIIHLTGLFLPWHRLYVHEWTNALRSKCGYKGVAPYAIDFENSSIWDPDPEVGLGGFGDPNDDNTVKTGGLNLTVTYPMLAFNPLIHEIFLRQFSSAHKLRRNYQPLPFASIPGYETLQANLTFTPAEIQKLLAQPNGNFTSFQYYMEKGDGMHSAVHGITGGDLAGLCPRGSNSSTCPFEGTPTFSPNEPMFQLHHGNVDRLWWLWQEKSLLNKFAFHGGSVQNFSDLVQFPNGGAPWLNTTDLIPTAGMFTSVSIGDILDTRSPPLCYIYE